MDDDRDVVRIGPLREALPDESLERLREGLNACPDVAFCHLVEVEVTEVGEGSSPTLFVWLEPAALDSLRTALNIVSEVVSRSLPEDRYLDVLILNSVPELLERVESVGGLLVERNPEERHRALQAAAGGGYGLEPLPPKRWWWPI
jgi:hypothetical protein